MPCVECEENGLECCPDCCNHEICATCHNHGDSVCSNCDCCVDCCECERCSSCREQVSETCSNCGYCAACCNCYVCSNCGEPVSSTCDGCDYCFECCSCRDGQGLFLEGMFRFHDSATFKLNSLKRYIALEIEVANADGSGHTQTILEDWGDSALEDGSLEGGYCYEIATNPSNGDKFIEHIDDLGNALAKDGATANHTCGLHCHVDASDYKWFDVYKLCTLYCKIERALYDLVAPSRYSNHYSMPAYLHYNFDGVVVKEFKQELLKRMYGRDFHNSYKDGMITWKNDKKVWSEKNNKYNQVRYYALNLHSFFYRGTIEFRHHHGTTNPDKMKNWGMICAHIIDYASKKNMKDIKSLPTEPSEALLKILPHDLAEWADKRAKELKPDGWTKIGENK